ncbi:MAG: DHH family phosphoesterase [Lachnospiraceae bacterium]|nr:DHH family phosphoesterase [Lachnospiraceae bacterium]
MNTIQIKGRLKAYLQAPLYMGVLFLAGSLILLKVNFRLGLFAGIVSLCYAVAIYIAYRITWKKLTDEIINFAVQYGTVQNRLLGKFQLPYAVMDGEGKILWMNERFMELSGKDRSYRKSISSIFSEVTRENIGRIESGSFTVQLTYNDRIYDAILEKLPLDEYTEDYTPITDSKKMIIEGIGEITSIMLVDVTERETHKKRNLEQQMVPALVYVDNYEEVMESVDEVKRSMLVAMIDRKVNRYFREIDGVVKKLERDKYFIIFQSQYLKTLEDGKFSLLEDIQTIKVGNDSVFTISIGIGMGASSYTQCSEYARAAIGMALGRGGSQVVIKDNQDVSYYGIRGREVEKNTRVKARVKAQALREMMETRSRVLVMGHSISDADALGAAVGVYVAATALGKPCQIVLNTVTSSLRPLVDMFTTDAGYPRDLFINSEEALTIVDNNTLVMVVDTNRPTYTECPQLLNRGGGVVVFDHHRHGNEKIKNPLLSYIEPYASSACEMLAEVLQYFADGITLTNQEADCIYAGILIDTNNFMTKTGVRTFEAAAFLRRSGADVIRVRKLLREDMSAYKARAEVVRNAEVYRNAFAISVCEAKEAESPTIVGAQASNELLNIVGIKASFVLTEYQGKIYVSSRSIDEIDVQLIMERLGGGGHLNVAGAQIEDATVSEVKRRVEDIIDVMMDEGEIKL